MIIPGKRKIASGPACPPNAEFSGSNSAVIRDLLPLLCYADCGSARSQRAYKPLPVASWHAELPGTSAVRREGRVLTVTETPLYTVTLRLRLGLAG